MFRKRIAKLAIGVGLSVIPLATQAANTIYSPTQAELSSVTFANFWNGNGAALNSITPVSTDGVEYNINTGFAQPTPDAYSRSQFEAPFTRDLTGLSAFDVDFQVPTGGSVNGSQLQAQLYLRYTGGSGFTSSGALNIGSAGRTTVGLNLSNIPSTSLNQITAFGIEIFSNGDPAPFGVDMGDKVRAFTSPQPPTYVDGFQISDFEGNDAGTWGPAFQPDHSGHTIVAADGTTYNNGVSKGTHALSILRTYTGDNANAGQANFRWGSQMVLNSSTGAAATADYNNNGTVDAADYAIWRKNLNTAFALPNRDAANTGNVSPADYTSWKSNFGKTGGGTDPVIQGKINAMVDAINTASHNGGKIALDVSINGIDHFPDANASFFGLDMFITDGSGGFFQPNTTLIGESAGQGLGFVALPALGDTVQKVTLSVPLSIFTDQSSNAFGALGSRLLQKNNNFTIGLSSNTNGDVTFAIDNIRIQNLAPGVGAAVPEPASLVLALMGLIGGGLVCHRRK